uniref:Uncharacterized protein n=1 Tax=Anopheles maculatus TaxID=74869 RepID=A0A182S965_9DIPT
MRALGIAQPNNHHQTTVASSTTSSTTASNVGSVVGASTGGSAAGINGKNGNGDGHHHGPGATLITLPRAIPAGTGGTNGDGNRAGGQLRVAGGVAGSVSDTAAQDTIYLCNFRVTVDGEWLCLKELQDLDIKDGQTGGGGGGGYGGGADALGGGGGGAAGGTSDCNALNSFGIIENVKCEEKIIERDWVNYY